MFVRWLLNRTPAHETFTRHAAAWRIRTQVRLELGEKVSAYTAARLYRPLNLQLGDLSPADQYLGTVRTSSDPAASRLAVEVANERHVGSMPGSAALCGRSVRVVRSSKNIQNIRV